MTSNREKSVDGYSTECILLYYPVYMGDIRLYCFGMVDPTTTSHENTRQLSLDEHHILATNESANIHTLPRKFGRPQAPIQGVTSSALFSSCFWEAYYSLIDRVAKWNQTLVLK
jgi:hypothetical protein